VGIPRGVVGLGAMGHISGQAKPRLQAHGPKVARYYSSVLNIFKNFRNSFKLLKFIRICTKFRKKYKVNSV
jgi:hypothetical protein